MTEQQAVHQFEHHYTRSLSAIVADLESYAALLRKWQPVQNLVSRETLPELWSRHFLDSLQLLPLLNETDQRFLDLGSGGGFPALPLAIALKGEEHSFTLLEPTQRKASFLRTVVRELGLNVEVLALRSDQYDSRETTPPDVITSRALASLPQLCTWMQPHMVSQTRALLHKGREHGEEVREAATLFHFDVLTTSSITDPAGVILTLSNLQSISAA
jgi:16S rRNA (guanine527-N7)-methyltransferase